MGVSMLNIADLHHLVDIPHHLAQTNDIHTIADHIHILCCEWQPGVGVVPVCAGACH